jgi:beta-galactosidase
MTENPELEIDLSGIWQIAFDPEAVGVRQAWPSDQWPVDRSLPIRVPEIWNISYPDAEGVGFYRRTFTIPATWQDQVLILHFFGVIYRCEVWVNGYFAGSHEGGFTPFDLEITGMVKPDEDNDLVVRVVALSRTKDIDGMKLTHSPLAKQSWHYVYGGIWGRVFLQSRPKISLRKLSIDPDLLNENIFLKVFIQNRREETRQVELCFEILDPLGKEVYTDSSQLFIPPGGVMLDFSIPIPFPQVWSCEQPNLYNLKTKIKDEENQTDSKTTHFGMRDFTVRDGQFFLNGDPLFIRGIILQPNYPIKMIEPTNRDMMIREMTLVKEAGFNLIRTHLQPPSEEYLDLADRMGILIYAETSLAWIKDNPRLLDHGFREIRHMINMDRNHPSVVFWGIYNENPTASAINGATLAQYARMLDPTRLVVTDSGASLAVDQDFCWIDRAAITPTWEIQPQQNFDVHLYLGAPIPTGVQNWLRNMGKGVSSKVLADERLGLQPVLEEFDRECLSNQGQIFVSELGCGGMADLDEQVAGFNGKEELLDARELKSIRDSLHTGFQERHLDQVFGNLKKLYREAQELQCIGNTQQVEALLVNPRVSGYAITQLNDVSWEFHAGLLDVWRNPKPAYYAAKRFNQPNLIILKPDHLAAKVGDRIMVEVVLVNRKALKQNAQAEISVFDPNKKEIQIEHIPFPIFTGKYQIKNLSITICQSGTYSIIARLKDETIVSETIETILALESARWKPLQVKVNCLETVSDISAILSTDQMGLSSQNGICENRKTMLFVGEPSALTCENWTYLIEEVNSGKTAIVGPLRPENNEAINAFLQHGIHLELHYGIGSWMGCYHWAPQSEIFSGLPAGGLLKKPYAEVLPKYVLSELGGTVLAGSLRNTIYPKDTSMMLWYSDIEIVDFGKGKILFCQYRIFDKVARNPLAARMVFNLLAYANSLADK